MVKKVKLFLIVALALGFVSCGPEELAYLLEQAPGQLYLLLDRVPIQRVLKRKDLDPEVRAKLELALEVKQYSEDKLGLVRNKSYTIYRELDRDALTYNLTACPKFSIEPLRWQFPVVGEMPYLGFFKKEDAQKKESELEGKGYDVYVRIANAYSMLGIVSDPLYTPMLKWDDYELVNTIIHELAHGTVWAKGYPEFNENLALFIGNQGAINYCVDKYGPDSEQVKYGLGSNQDDYTFYLYINTLADQLRALYSRTDLSDAEKLREKQGIFENTKKDFTDNWIPKMKTDYYAAWPKRELNNATVAGRLVYYHDLSLYQKVYEKNGSDLEKMVGFLQEMIAKNPGDPEKYLKEWLKSGT